MSHSILATIRHTWPVWLLITAVTPLLFYVMQLLGLIVRFDALPNYFNTYHWPANVKHIFQSTPSLHDAAVIAADEWLLEIGHMNYDFGHGLSEWSLVIAPVEWAGLTLFSALIATYYAQSKARRHSCPKPAASAAGGLGTALMAVSSMSMTWVVCCSTPTWVVGLSMMGLGISTALWLEPAGGWLKGLGLLAMLGAIALRRGGSSQPLPVSTSPIVQPLPETV